MTDEPLKELIKDFLESEGFKDVVIKEHEFGNDMAVHVVDFSYSGGTKGSILDQYKRQSEYQVITVDLLVYVYNKLK